MGITTKALQLDEMAAGDISGGDVGELLQQRDGLDQHLVLFAVQERHQPELTFGSLLFLLNPTPLQGLLAEGLGLLVAGESLRLTAPDLTAELIQKQHKGEAARWRMSPGLKLADQCPIHKSSKTIAHQRIEAAAAAKPLPWTALLKPELQNVVCCQDEQL